MAPCRALIERIRRRDLFPFIGELLLSPQQLVHPYSCKKADIKQELLDIKETYFAKAIVESESVNIDDNDIFVCIVKMGYGKVFTTT